jgi:hypothetical protein
MVLDASTPARRALLFIQKDAAYCTNRWKTHQIWDFAD